MSKHVNTYRHDMFCVEHITYSHVTRTTHIYQYPNFESSPDGSVTRASLILFLIIFMFVRVGFKTSQVEADLKWDKF
jgi:hypothetical protein